MALIHTSTTHFLQSMDKDGKISTVGHSKDEKTGEIFCHFINKKQAIKLMEDEKKVSPEYKYRIMTEKKTYTPTSWS